MDYRLTSKLRELKQLLLPLIADLDGPLFVILGLSGNSGLLGIDDNPHRLIGVERVQNGEEILSLAPLSFGIGIGEVIFHARELNAELV